MAELYFYAIEQQLADGTWTREGVARRHPRRFTDGIHWNGEESIRRLRKAAGVELDQDTLRLYGNCLPPTMPNERAMAGVDELAAILGRPTRLVEIVELCTDQERKMLRPDVFWVNAKAAVLEALAAEAVTAALTGTPMRMPANDATGHHTMLASSRMTDEPVRDRARTALAAGARHPETDSRRLETLVTRDVPEGVSLEGHADEIIVSRQDAEAALVWAATIPGWDPVNPQIYIRDQANPAHAPAATGRPSR